MRHLGLKLEQVLKRPLRDFRLIRGIGGEKLAPLDQVTLDVAVLNIDGDNPLMTAGTDTTSIRTAAVRKGDVYVVNGQKIWTSRAEHSDLMLLLARTTPREQAKSRTDGLSMFMIDVKRDVRAFSAAMFVVTLIPI
mgnify:CR=1 FL=1